jgi:hypothetical protein
MTLFQLLLSVAYADAFLKGQILVFLVTAVIVGRLYILASRS